jgi:hypothetical protein
MVARCRLLGENHHAGGHGYRARRGRGLQRVERDPTRARGRPSSAANLRPAGEAGASVLSHVSGERSGPLFGTVGLPAQPQSAGE